MFNYTYLTSPTITLVVGPDDNQESFVVHEQLLASRSHNIANALKPGYWREGDDCVISFPDQDPVAFAAYLNFVYHPYLLSLIVRVPTLSARNRGEASHISIPSPSTIDLSADFTQDLVLSLISARALPLTTVDATTRIINPKLEVQVAMKQRDVHERRLEGHCLRLERLNDGIEEWRTRNNDCTELDSRDPRAAGAGDP